MRRITRTAAALRLAATIAMAVALSACGDIAGMSADGTTGISSVTSPAASASGSPSSSASSSSSSSATTTTSTATAADTSAQSSPIEFSAQTYSVAQHAGAVILTVDRTGPATSPASVNYSTANGTAVAGTDYERVDGTLEWAENDSTSKTI